MLKSLLLLIVSFFTFSVFTQSKISGIVKDSISGEPIPFVKVKVQGQNNGANTDFDGAYSIQVAPGNYVLIFSMPNDGYEDLKKAIAIENQETLYLNVSLIKESSIIQITEATVSHVKIEGASSIEADDIRRQEAKSATDGMTREQMQNTGAGSAVEAAAMVPGLSIEDGKTVYVRGLGDRYTKTILNGMEIPGLDPERNSVQLDIFPTTVIDNITVYKTYTPNFSGDFTGGLVDITTKDFPASKLFYVKASLGYNTLSTFNKDYLSYQGGKLDFLGFDDGTREMPVRTTDVFIDPSQSDPSLTQMTSSFSDIMAAEKAKNFLNQNYSFNYGDKFSKELKSKNNLDYGFNLVLNYRNNHNFYQDVQFNEYRKDPEKSNTNILPWRLSSGDLSENSIMWTALLGQSIKIKNSKYSLTLLHTQNGVSSTSILTQEDVSENPAILEKNSLMYTQRSVSNANLSGRHLFGKNRKLKFDWKLSPTLSMISDPDMRSTALEKDTTLSGETFYSLTQSVGAEIRRTFRDLMEYNLSGRFDLTYRFNIWDSLESKLIFGALNTYKKRTFDVYDYIFLLENVGTPVPGLSSTAVPQDPNWYFQDENIWNVETDQGTYGKGEQIKANSFVASQNVKAIYIMNELPINKNFDATYGVRLEHATNNYTGQNNLATIRYENERVLDELSILPSINLVYRINKEKTESKNKRITNLRGAYTKTVARPSFREKSISQIYDPIQGRRYNGNIDLLQTSIHNADLRYEYFFGRTELISVSLFYKNFIEPIEMVSFNKAPREIQPINSGQADLYGAEFEFRKAIGFKSKPHISFVLGANFTYVISRVNMNNVIADNSYDSNNDGTPDSEKEIRQDNAREGEVIGDYRPMFGQSPFIVNGFLTFKNDTLGLILSLSYNVQGKKLAVIGVGALPDVYENSFHSLNLKVSKLFGKNNRWKASLSGRNLLASSRLKLYESYQSLSQIYESFNPGIQISGSVTYVFKGKRK